MSVNVETNLRTQDTQRPCHTIAHPLGRTIKQINQVATCHSLVLSISKLITSFNEDKRFVCSCLSALPVRLSAPRMQILYSMYLHHPLYKDTRYNMCVYIIRVGWPFLFDFIFNKCEYSADAEMFLVLFIFFFCFSHLIYNYVDELFPS